MLTFHVRELHALLPLLLRGHLTAKKLHHDIHSLDIIAHVGRKVGTDPKRRPDAIAAIVVYLDGFIHVEAIRKHQVLTDWVHPQLLVTRDHLVDKQEGIAAIVPQAGKQGGVLLTEVTQEYVGGIGISKYRS